LKERKEKSKRQSSLLPLGCKVKLLCCSLTIDKALILVWQWKITWYDNNGKPAILNVPTFYHPMEFFIETLCEE